MSFFDVFKTEGNFKTVVIRKNHSKIYYFYFNDIIEIL